MKTGTVRQMPGTPLSFLIEYDGNQGTIWLPTALNISENHLLREGQRVSFDEIRENNCLTPANLRAAPPHYKQSVRSPRASKTLAYLQINPVPRVHICKKPKTLQAAAKPRKKKPMAIEAVAKPRILSQSDALLDASLARRYKSEPSGHSTFKSTADGWCTGDD